MCRVAGENLGGMPWKWTLNGGSCLLWGKSREESLSTFGFPEMAKEKESTKRMVSEIKEINTMGKNTFGVET